MSSVNHMRDLADFAKCIDEVLADSDRRQHWSAEEASQYMARFASRRERFEELAGHLIGTIIRPRLELLASYFTNAVPGTDDIPSQCSYWFGYCERFPASTQVMFAVEHDSRFDSLLLRYRVHMMPVFIKLTEHDSLTLPLAALDEQAVATWTEERLLEFLDDYLRIDRGDLDSEDESTTDPVCGMRINRRAAVANTSYLGHPYYFCSETCRQQFVADPKHFVQIKNE